MNLLRLFHPIPFLQPNKSSSSLFQHPKHRLPSSSSFHVKLKLPSSIHIQEETRETFDFEDEDEFQEEEEEEEEEEDVYVPLSNMRQWTRNKPRGFGEGKVYDTTLEDKLLEELEQSKAAQLANINNLNNNNLNPNPKPKEAPNGIRVRLVNLPKKKNIHRDLQAAFKPFTGITHIIPAVSGNQKTRDPLCKGSAFVHFNSHKEANRFVDIISRQPITFGKVQKQIRCEIVVDDSTESPLNATMAPPVTEIPCVEDSSAAAATDDEKQLHQVFEGRHEEAQVSSEKHKVVVSEKTTRRARKKVENIPKQNIPGSANRLKMKEKALLSGVFSKYGGK